jgi:hypothetical protein
MRLTQLLRLVPSPTQCPMRKERSMRKTANQCPMRKMRKTANQATLTTHLPAPSFPAYLPPRIFIQSRMGWIPCVSRAHKRKRASGAGAGARGAAGTARTD